jgi:polynucleotide 5'-kinase involved in rRNA processing
MIKDFNLEEGHTLIVKGPARINLQKGKLEVFGKLILSEDDESISSLDNLEEQNVLIIPGAKTYPLYAVEDSKLEVTTGSEENLEEIDENSIPEEWIDYKDKLLNLMQKKKDEKPLKIMVLGISCGKTTLIKYLSNNFYREGFKGAYLDTDLGQQIMMVPCVISIGEIEKPIVSSVDLEPDNIKFIGATYPKGNLKFVLSQFSQDLIEEFENDHKNTDFILIDTDGWIKNEAGVVFKKFFIEKVDPDVILAFYNKEIEEYDEILDKAKEKKGRKIFLIKEENGYYYEKTKDERRFLRQSRFSKVLEDFRKITIPLNEIQFIKHDYDKENDEVVEKEIKVEDLIELPYHYVIIALLDEDSNLINIGLLFSVNIEKNYILMFSDLNYKEQYWASLRTMDEKNYK